MHYRNQRAAKVGDQVVGRDRNGLAFAGTLIKANPGSETCNGMVQPTGGGAVRENVTIGELLHVDDALAEKPEGRFSEAELIVWAINAGFEKPGAAGV